MHVAKIVVGFCALSRVKIAREGDVVYLKPREEGAVWIGLCRTRNSAFVNPSRIGVAACVAFGQKSSWPPSEMPITKGKIIRVGGQSKEGQAATAARRGL